MAQPFQDVNGLPGATGDEAAHQQHIGIRDMVIGNAAIATIADMIGPLEGVLAQPIIEV